MTMRESRGTTRCALSSGMVAVSDVSQLDSTIRGAQIRHAQMGQGRFMGCVHRVKLVNGDLGCGSYNLSTSIFGLLPHDAFVFAYIETAKGWGHLNNQQISKGVWCFQPGDVLAGLLPECFCWFIYSIKENALNDQLVGRGIDPMKLKCLGTGRLVLKEGTDSLEHLGNELRRNITVASPIGEVDNLEVRLTMLFLNVIGNEPVRVFQNRRPAIVLKIARNYLHSHLAVPVTMKELCGVLDCGRRKVELAFRDAYNCGPVAYHRILRLNEVRRCLLVRGQERGVVSVAALDFGFTHLGRFASAYQGLFEENPSATGTQVLS